MARAAKQAIQIDMPTNTLEHVLITTSTYTFLETDIEAFKVFVIDASVTDCTITIPATTLTGLQFINLIQESAGTITIIPSETFNQQQYVSTSTQNISLISRTPNVWNLYRGDVTVSAFTNAVTGVSVTPATITIDEAATTQLTVEFFPENATDQTGTWSTNDALVATVSSSGLVTGVAAGSATITFTSTDGSFTDTCVVTVEVVVALRPSLINTWEAVSTTNSITFTASPTTGNLLLVQIGKGSSKDDSVVPAGWTLLHQTISNFGEHDFFWKISDGTETSQTFTLTGTSGSGQIYVGLMNEFTNVDTVTPFEGLVTTGRTQSLLTTIPSVTSTISNALAVHLWVGLNNESIDNPQTGFPSIYTNIYDYNTLLGDDARLMVHSANIEVQTLGSDTFAFSNTPSPTFAAVTLVIRPQ